MLRKIFAFVLILMLIALPMQAVKAVPKEEYKYKVVIYAGNQGTVKGSSEYVMGTYSAGEPVEIKVADLNIALKDADKYYVRGLVAAGHDADDTGEGEEGLIVEKKFQIKEDLQYVVLYGVRDDGMVKYTVKFVEEETGKELASSSTYEGRVGDKPIVSHKYISGYIPNALNATKTLTSNEADNVFTFKYTKSENATNTIYETIYGPGGTGGGGGGGGATPSGGETTPEGGGETPTPAPTPSGGGEELPPEIIDDDNPPLAPGGDDNTPGGNGGGNSRILAYVAAAVGVAAVSTGIILFARKKRDDDEDDEE